MTDAGEDELQQIKHDVKSLRDADLAPAEMKTYMAGIHDRIRAVLDTQLVPDDEGADTSQAAATTGGDASTQMESASDVD